MFSTRFAIRRVIHLCLLLMLTAACAPDLFPAADKTARAADGERVSTICLPPEMSGLNLILDLDAEPLDAAILPNGEWWLRQGLPDGTLLIESRRLPALEYDGEALRRLILAEWPLARDIEVAPFPALADTISYPAFEAKFLNGENEDTRQFAAALVFTEEWSFWFALSASADTELTPEDRTDAAASTPGDRLKKDLKTVLLGVKPADPFEGGFLPGFIPAFYMAGPDSTLPISVMDALVRIKKIVGPEHSPWVGQEGLAYRYDGPGMAAGVPVLRFSFGAEGQDGFTAKRQFAVDAERGVYERELAGDGEYWKWDERGAFWWGTYRRGEVHLGINNYREGPFGMYFIFTFMVGEKTVFEGTAPVRGRTAHYGPLVFSLAENDDSITVTIDPEAKLDREDLPDLEGTYTAHDPEP